MVLHHLRKGLKIGAESARLSAKMVEKELRPLIKAGQLTAKDAKKFALEAVALGKKSKVKAAAVAKAEAKKLVRKMGYVSKSEVDSLKKRVVALEKKHKPKRK